MRIFTFTPRSVLRVASALKINSSVTTIGLANNVIEDEGARQLGEALKINSSITTLNLQNSCIGADGLRHLGEALKINSSVMAIYLHANDYCYSEIESASVDGLWALHQASTQRSTLTIAFCEMNMFQRDLAVGDKIIQDCLFGNIHGLLTSCKSCIDLIVLTLLGFDTNIILQHGAGGRWNLIAFGRNDIFYRQLSQQLLEGDTVFDWARRHVYGMEILEYYCRQLDCSIDRLFGCTVPN
eukprot:m.123129 g.123129  ORF g.123129 m.123129 type:complete len:241 (+) comp13745_c0_seq10:101-823(+)